jgi:nucleoside 2-deoxyribosyltransferase
MKKIEIYLAGACKHEIDEGSGWRGTIVNDWEDADIKFINPLDYFRYSENWHQSDKQVKQYYQSRIRKCDVVLVNLNNSNTSCGTCQEIQYAVDHDVPVIGFGKDNVYAWLLVDCQCVFDTAEEAMEYIVTYYSE